MYKWVKVRNRIMVVIFGQFFSRFRLPSNGYLIPEPRERELLLESTMLKDTAYKFIFDSHAFRLCLATPEFNVRYTFHRQNSISRRSQLLNILTVMEAQIGG